MVRRARLLPAHPLPALALAFALGIVATAAVPAPRAGAQTTTAGSARAAVPPREVLVRLRALPSSRAGWNRLATEGLFAGTSAFRLTRVLGSRSPSTGSGPRGNSLSAVHVAPGLPEEAAAELDPLLRTFSAPLPPGLTLEAALAVLERDPAVEWAAPNRVFTIDDWPETIALEETPPAGPPGEEGRSLLPPPDGGISPRAPGDGARTPPEPPPGRRPNDPLFDFQEHHPTVHAPEAWSLTTGDSTILVAIVDTGIDLDHPDLAPNLWKNDDPPGNARTNDDDHDQDGDGNVEPWELDDDDDNGFVDDALGWDFTDAPAYDGVGDYIGRDSDPRDDIGHGTAVAGVAGAAGNNGIGGCGIAWKVGLMALRAGFRPAFGSGLLEEDDAAAAIVYAADNGARVINLSFGDTAPSLVLEQAIRYAGARGALVVAAAGNGGSTAPVFPGALSGVLSVGASEEGTRRAPFSSYGGNMAFLAPGVRILSTVPGGLYARASGTSFAAPVAAGAAALLLSRDPALRPAAIRARLREAARDAGVPGFDDETGAGNLDVEGGLLRRSQTVVELRSPGVGQSIDAEAVIVGSAYGDEVVGYSLSARDPGGATIGLLPFLERHALSDTLLRWGTSLLPEGAYEVVLGARLRGGVSREARVRIRIDHAAPALDGLSVRPAFDGSGFSIHATWTSRTRARGHATLRRDGRILAERAEANVATAHSLVFRGPFPDGTYEVEAGSRGENGRDGESRTLPVRVETFQDFRGTAVPVRPLGPGEVFPFPTDFDRDGIPEVLFECRDGADPYGTLTASELSDTGLHETFFAPDIRIYPVAVEDVHGDGATDVLGLRLEQMRLYRGSGSVTFPDRLVWSDTTSGTWAAGIIDLDPGDGTMEMVGLRGNDFIIYRETDPLRRPDDWEPSIVLVNPTPGTNVTPPRYVFFRPTISEPPVFAAADADGDVWCSRWNGDAFVPAGAVRLPHPSAGGIGVVPDEGAPLAVATVVNGDPGTDPTASFYRHYFLSVPAGGVVAVQDSLDVLGAGSGTEARVVGLPVTPDGEIVDLRGGCPGLPRPQDFWIAASPDLYRAGTPGDSVNGGILADIGTGRIFQYWRPAIDGCRSWPDLFVAPTRGGVLTVYSTAVSPPAFTPRGVVATPLHQASIRVDWRNEGSYPFVIYRSTTPDFACGEVAPFDTLAAPPLIDERVLSGTRYYYRVAALQGPPGEEAPGPCSEAATAMPGPPPLLSIVDTFGPTTVRVRYSNPMGPSAFTLAPYTVTRVSDLAVLPVATLGTQDGQTVLLEMEAPLERGAAYRLRVNGVADSLGVPLEASEGEREFRGGSERRTLHFRGASFATPTQVRLALSEPMGGTSENATLYSIDRGIAIRLAGILPGGSPPGSEILLTLDPSTPIEGGRYRITLSTKLRAASGSAVREGEGDTWLLDAGVRAYPDPVRAGAGARQVAFAHAGEASRIRIYDASGRLVRTLEGEAGGSDPTWDLKNEAGDEVRSGTYFFRLSAAGRTAKGKLVVLR